MAAFREGVVRAVLEAHDDLMRVSVDVGGAELTASVFPEVTGPVAPDDRVVVNTLGVDLALGTGGEGFVLWNLSNPRPPGPGRGHIVKLRYTPLQIDVAAAEAQESAHHDLLEKATSIDGMPVVACGLHSQMPAVAAGIKAAAPAARVAYVMSDGAGLPLAWSDLVRAARGAVLIDVSCTYGHAFGGDYEAVNVYSALAAARHAGGADAVVVAMGPGVVGTSSALGFTAMEQGVVLDATSGLSGAPIACLRICWADERERHRGLSHHSVTALTIGTRSRVTVAVPSLGERDDEVAAALDSVAARHELVTADGAPGLALMDERGVRPGSMGRRFEEIPELFLAGAAAGAVAASRL